MDVDIQREVNLAMRLYLNKTSPYARLVMAVAYEKGLAQKIELAFTDPWADPDELLGVNPFAKVPVLVTDDGLSLTESSCICDYIDEIENGRRLMPAFGPSRLSTIRKYGFGRGLIDCAFGVTIERRFVGGSNKSALEQRWLSAVTRALQAMEGDETISLFAEQPDLGDLAIAIGLSYTEFRLPEVRWRETAPRLSKWMDQMADRPSMRLTAPR